MMTWFGYFGLLVCVALLEFLMYAFFHFIYDDDGASVVICLIFNTLAITFLLIKYVI